MFEKFGLDANGGTLTEVELLEVMTMLGYVRPNDNNDINSVSALWPHMRPNQENEQQQ